MMGDAAQPRSVEPATSTNCQSAHGGVALPMPPEAAPPPLPKLPHSRDRAADALGDGEGCGSKAFNQMNLTMIGPSGSRSMTLEAFAAEISAALAHRLADAVGNTVASKVEEMAPRICERITKQLARQRPSSAAHLPRKLALDNIEDLPDPCETASEFARQTSAGSAESGISGGCWQRSVTELQQDIASKILQDSSSRRRRGVGSLPCQDTSGSRPKARITPEVDLCALEAAVAKEEGEQDLQKGDGVIEDAARCFGFETPSPSGGSHDASSDAGVPLPGTNVEDKPPKKSTSGNAFSWSRSEEDVRSPSKMIMTNAEVFRSRVDELMEVIPSAGGASNDSSSQGAQDTRCEQLLLFCFRAGGILSWGGGWCTRCSTTYKGFVMLLAVGALVWTCVEVMADWQGEYFRSEFLCMGQTLACGQQASLLSDVLMAAGSVAVLASLGCARGQARLDDIASVLHAYACQHEVHDLWMRHAKRDAAFMLFTFICANVAGFSGMVGSATRWSNAPTTAALHYAVLFTVTALLMLVILFLLFVLRLLVVLVDVFCFQLVESLHISEAAHNWNVLQALLHKASFAMEFGLLAFLSVAAFAIPAFMLDYMLLGLSAAVVRLQLPHVLVVGGVLRVFVMAATVTGKCMRVPALINSLSFGPGTDRDRQHLVDYIANSAAGFYIFNVRLNTGMVVKFMYMWAVIIFGIVSRGVFQD